MAGLAECWFSSEPMRRNTLRQGYQNPAKVVAGIAYLLAGTALENSEKWLCQKKSKWLLNKE
jgi:hypothetical protein